jgi:acyl-CoA synthetase (AMP-forming)/AMP-acid ligase II
MALYDFFDRGCLVNPNGTAYIMGEQQWSFEEARELSCQVAHALDSLDLAKGTKTAVLSANHPESWLCVIGLWRAGCTWVPVNPMSSLEEQDHLLNGFDVEVLFFQEKFIPVIKQLRSQCPNIKQWICIDGKTDDSIHLKSWIAEQPTTQPSKRVDEADLAAIMPTGGTTGLPKGVMLSHRTLGLSINFSIINNHYSSDQAIVNLAAAPMTHTAGFLSLPATARGGTVVVLPKPDPDSLINTIEQNRVTEFFLPPTVIYRLLDIPKIKERDFSSLQYFMYGAAPMAIEKLKEAISVFGPVMAQGYGQSEAPGGIAALRTSDHFVNGEIAPDERLTACGRPSELNCIAIMDDDQSILAQGETGEICIRGDIVMDGYYKMPEKTAETIIDGWLHTGDLGHLDQEGYLHITDRKRDMIISGGFNVFPSEVEQVLWTHPAVLDCAVIGIPHEQWGETVKAVVELKQGTQVSEEELIALCKEKLGSVKAPKSVDFVKSLPRSPVGKVLKKEIREPYWRDADRTI